MHLVACGRGLQSESAFLCSVYFAPQERSHLPEENLVSSIFLKDKIGKQRGAYIFYH